LITATVNGSTTKFGSAPCTTSSDTNSLSPLPAASPLTVAAGNGDSELVSLLVVHGADPNFVVDPLTVAGVHHLEVASQLFVAFPG
jgi:hypothetical protein